MASAAVQLDEAALIREIIDQVEMPKGIRFKRLDPMLESTGESAWRITLSVSKSIPLTKKRLSEIRAVENTIMEKVFALKLGKWPFFHLIDSK